MIQSGDVYVVDAFRVEKFSPTGAFISKWAVAGGSNLWDISLDSANNVYLTFSYQQIVRKYTQTGTLITTIGAPGTANGQFGTTLPSPTGIAINPSTGVVYVADTGNKRMQFFGPDAASTASISITSVNSSGTGPSNQPRWGIDTIGIVVQRLVQTLGTKSLSIGLMEVLPR